MISLFMILAIGTLIYIFIDGLITLAENPVGTSIQLKSGLSGLSLSICLPQYTGMFLAAPFNPALKNPNISFSFQDLASTADFWTRGNNLSTKISMLRVRQSSEEDQLITVWPTSFSEQQQNNLFSINNIVFSEDFIDFCHTLDLSQLPYKVSQVIVNAVEDITLVVHLSGQLYSRSSSAYYQVFNVDTMQILNNVTLTLYPSEVNVHLEKITSLNDKNSAECMIYNSTWSYDNCIVDSAVQLLGNGHHGSLLTILLRPNSSNWVAEAGVPFTVLQDLYTVLLSGELQKNCWPDCNSLVAELTSEASALRAEPTTGFPRLKCCRDVEKPLPALNATVNLTIPDMSRLSEVCHFIHVTL
jgi:hypothetical protein